MLKEERLSKILIRPVITEKATALSEKSHDGAQACLVFEVSRRADKSDVCDAIELFFGVKAHDVRLLNVKRRYRNRRSRALGIRRWKKAYISLDADQAKEILEANHGLA